MAGTPPTSSGAHSDGINQHYSIIAVQGTLGTADTSGTAYTIPVGANPATNAMYVEVTNQGASSNPTGGTLNLVGTVGTILGAGTLSNLGSFTNGGTIKEITNIAGGTITAALALNTGTITTIAAGTQNTLGTVGTVIGVGTLTNVGSLTNGGTIKEITNIAGGTITTTLALNTGTITTIAAGTLNTLGTVGIVNALATGTIGGKAASGAASVANPVQIAGTDAGGTVYSPLITTAGVQLTGLTSSGTLLNLATGTIASLPAVSLTSSGTILNLATGTIASVGTLVGAGTITNLGSVTNVGSLTNFGTGKELTNLVGGTITAVNSIVAGTQNTLGTVGVVNNLVTGTIATLTNQVGGTITAVNSIVAGTQNTLGTVGVINNGTISINQVQIGSTVLTYGSLGTTGAAVYGTLVPAVGAGTSIYLTGLSAVVQSGTVDVAIANGTFGPASGPGGANVYARGAVPAGGGIMTPITQTIKSGTNGTLIYWMGGAGTAYFLAQYWVGP